MKRFAVAYVLLLDDNEVIVDIVEADTIKEAICKHQEIAKYDDTVNWLNEMPNDLDIIKEAMFDGEISIDVKEIV